MALIVEDGTGLPDAESYASVAAADAYLVARGNVAWGALSQGAREAALRKATDYLGDAYGQRWLGWRLTTTQALDWPRGMPTTINYQFGYPPVYGPPIQQVDLTGVPPQVVRACIELAARASLGVELMPDATAAVRRERVDVIEVEYAESGAPSTGAAGYYRSIDAMLAPLLTGSVSTLRVVRA